MIIVGGVGEDESAVFANALEEAAAPVVAPRYVVSRLVLAALVVFLVATTVLYFLHPDQRVKDARTKYGQGNFHAVMDGDIQGFLDAVLRWRAGQPVEALQ